MDSYETARMQKGIRIAEMLWFSFAQRIFAVAADLYGWTPKRRAELEDIYLRPNDYTIEVVVMQ
jgi:hypothetical protein